MADHHNHGELGTRVAIVEKELETVYGIFSKFEATLEKITEVSSSLKELIAVHDNRLMERERADHTIFELIEKRKEEYSRGVERVHQKMEDLSTDLRREIRDEINEQYGELKEVVQRFEQSQKDIADKIDKRIDQQIGERDRKFKEPETKLEKLEERVKKLENWRWLIVGGGTAVGFVIGKWGFFANLLT
jgi:DNA repair exonuclease SbcCD ATPase subunit